MNPSLDTGSDRHPPLLYDQSARVELPSSTKPFRRRPVHGVGTDVFVENLPANLAVSRHCHPQWQICLGFSRAVYDAVWQSPSGPEERRQILAGEVLILPPGWMHHAHWLEPAAGLWLYIDPARVSRSFPDLPLEASVLALAQFVVAQPMIADLARDLRQFAGVPNGESDWHVACGGSLLASLVFETWQQLRERVLAPLIGLAATIVERIAAHVEIRTRGRIPITHIARKLGISPRHLRRVFLRATGLSPRAWALQRKAEHARKLLASGCSVKETVEQAGFADHSHLNRALREAFGVTAAKLRAVAGRSV